MIADPMDPVIANDVQGAFPNQLASAVIQGGNLFVPNIGASPEPPVVFNVNVQGLVHVVDVATADEVAAKTVNLNAEVKARPTRWTRRASTSSSATISSPSRRADGSAFFIVSRGGNFVFRATLDGTGKLTLGEPADAHRHRQPAERHRRESATGRAPTSTTS
jgi:hypothetical protein